RASPNPMRAGQWVDCLYDVADIDKLRKGLGGEERADLEAAHAGSIFVADPALLGLRRRKGLHKLQAVAQAHLTQDHAAIGIDFLNVGHARFLIASFFFASSARIASVAPPSGGTFS